MNDLAYDSELIDRQMDLYERGRILKSGVSPEAWEIIFDTVHSYTEDFDQQVRSISPGDPSVLPAQAALYAMNKFETFFKQDTVAAMEFASHPPEEFRQQLYGVREASDVLKAQEQSSR